MNHGPGLFLWDIDGTLLDAHGQARAAWEHAFFLVWNIPGALSGIKLRGATDSRVMHLLQEQHHLQRGDRLGLFKQTYRRALLAKLQSVPPTPTEGAAAFLVRMHEAGWLHAIATGNFYVGANWKLRKAGLRPYFAWGAYAEQAEDRADILRAALNRVIRRTRQTPGRIVVAGDTERDIAAARSVGIPCLAVARDSRQAVALKASGADFVVSDFGEADRIVQWLSSLAGSD